MANLMASVWQSGLKECGGEGSAMVIPSMDKGQSCRGRRWCSLQQQAGSAEAYLHKGTNK